ncbi:MAG: ATP-binding protein [Proteobacteria bacterium]|nr:ATP-binding protein [Pseudomonadota bacterium]
MVLGPRQVGKTTTVKQIVALLPKTSRIHYAAADAVFRSDWSWIERQWMEAEALGDSAILILDEVQKIDNWSEVVKKLWDASLHSKTRLKVVLLGSSSLALQSGLSESLAGRFELIRAYHWNFPESQRAFGHSLDDYLIYGGYPGANRLRSEESRWLTFIKSSIVETVLDKDIMQLRRVERPSLFRQVFELVCSYPAAEISLRKLVGQLQDTGSVETVKHYLELLEGAYLIRTLQKYSTNPLQKKSSSPKILPLCPALCTFARGETSLTPDLRGRLFELSVGLDLIRLDGQLYYWRQDQIEVDYVYKHGSKIYAIEVKSGRRKSPHGLVKFRALFSNANCLVITPDNYPDFAKNPAEYLLAQGRLQNHRGDSP